MRTKLKITEGIFPMPVLMVATYNEDNSVNVTADESVMVDGKIDISKVNAIAFDLMLMVTTRLQSVWVKLSKMG